MPTNAELQQRIAELEAENERLDHVIHPEDYPPPKRYFRAYIQHKTNGEFIRVADGESDSAEDWKPKLKKNEVVDQVVELTFPEQADA